jgi:hypothetical protein
VRSELRALPPRASPGLPSDCMSQTTGAGSRPTQRVLHRRRFARGAFLRIHRPSNLVTLAPLRRRRFFEKSNEKGGLGSSMVAENDSSKSRWSRREKKEVMSTKKKTVESSKFPSFFQLWVFWKTHTRDLSSDHNSVEKVLKRCVCRFVAVNLQPPLRFWLVSSKKSSLQKL